jgi:hypothetical protein
MWVKDGTQAARTEKDLGGLMAMYREMQNYERCRINTIKAPLNQRQVRQVLNGNIQNWVFRDQIEKSLVF